MLNDVIDNILGEPNASIGMNDLASRIELMFTHLIGQMTARAARIPWCASSIHRNVRGDARECADSSQTAIIGVLGEIMATRSPGCMPSSRRA